VINIKVLSLQPDALAGRVKKIKYFLCCSDEFNFTRLKMCVIREYSC